MKKILYEEYQMKLKGKEYNILTPKIPLDETWVEVIGTTEDDSLRINVDGNRATLQVLYDVQVTLILEPEKIVYLPIRNIPVLEGTPEGTINYDLVFYNYQIQFQRHKWKELRQMMKYRRPVLHMVKYSEDTFIEQCERKWARYIRSQAYDHKKSRSKEWCVPKTVFLESSADLRCEDIRYICKMLEQNFAKLQKGIYKEWVCMRGLEYYFMTREINNLRINGK